jgi:hypothetical protein
MVVFLHGSLPAKYAWGAICLEIDLSNTRNIQGKVKLFECPLTLQAMSTKNIHFKRFVAWDCPQFLVRMFSYFEVMTPRSDSKLNMP